VVLCSRSMRVKGGSSNPLCSRNPHDETVVVRRAQWRITGSRPYKRGVTSKLGQTILMVSSRYVSDYAVKNPALPGGAF
jgi:hypothetical protein